MNRLRQWWSNLFVAECPDCGEAVPVFAQSCDHCGARNEARRGAIVVVASLLVLILAVGAAGSVVLGWHQLAVGTAQQRGGSGAGEADFGWLSAAMKECDQQASTEAGTLHFLVIPLLSKREDDERWRSVALNDLGNAILLSSDDALEGLRKGTLRISTQEYLFSIRDEATEATYRWQRSNGVAKFSTAKADAIESFTIHFQTRDRPHGVDSGNIFVRQKGACHWVNAIIGN